MELNAYVITLRRSVERAKQTAKLVAHCPVPCTPWDAVDGREMTLEQQAALQPVHPHTPPYPFPLNPGEIGCFLSHRSLWKHMVERAIPRALILEDDVEFLPNFAEILQFAARHADVTDYIQFPVRELHPRGKIVVSEGGLRLLQPAVIPLRTSAQLVTLGATEKLLQHTETFDRPVDTFLQMKWLHGVQVLTVMPRSVIEVSMSLGGSTIGNKQKRKTTLGVVSREWKRTLYRCRVASFASRNNRSVDQRVPA